RQNAHHSRVLPSFLQDLHDPVFFAKALPAAHKLDLQSILRGDSLHVLAKLVSQRLGPLWVIEDAQLVLVKIVGHPAGVTPAWYRALNEDPVIAGKNAHDLVFVPFGQQLDAHSGIVTHFLFGSGYAGLGIGAPHDCKSFSEVLFFFCAQRGFANSDKRLRSAAVIPPLAGFGADCLATGFFALGCALAASFRAAHLARRASAILLLKAGLTLRRPLVPACFTPDFFSGTSAFFAAEFNVFLALFLCGRLGFDDTRSTGSALGFVFCAMSNPKSAERSSPPPSTLAAAGPFFESGRSLPAFAISSFSSTL